MTDPNDHIPDWTEQDGPYEGFDTEDFDDSDDFS